VTTVPAALPRRFPAGLLAAYAVWFLVLGIAPHSRAVWFAENLPIVGIVAALAVLHHRGVRLSNLGYALAAVLPFLHTLGGHYTFERVPFGLVTSAFGFERNHFDRVAHFSVGFYAFAIVEVALARGLVRGRGVAYLLGVSVIGTVAAVYEIIEWIYAVVEGGDAGAAFLGSQGDPWDAQKDMLADTLGALFACAVHRAARGGGSPGGDGASAGGSG